MGSFGHIVRFITRTRVFKFIDERDPSIWKRVVNEEKSGYMAHHGTTEPHGDDSDAEDGQGLGGVRTREEKGNDKDDDPSDRPRDSSQDTQVPDGHNHVSGVKIDPEKGRDVHLIDFLPNDPENPLNWSTSKKSFVTFLICLLTTGVYIGSAIFTAGIEDFMREFGVARVPATLGLTIFVAGYGLGPML